jgi:exodeoxyribonuclease-3
MKNYKIISWNINSLKSMLKSSNIHKLLLENKPHVLCLSEIKLSDHNCDKLIEEFDNLIIEIFKKDIYKYKYYHYDKNGYSGVAVLSRVKPININYGFNNKLEDEGRLIYIEFSTFNLVNVYTPNSGVGLKRLDYRINTWDVNFNKYIKEISEDTTKPLIICGDLNVAHHDIDLKNPKTNKKTAGFTDKEKKSFDILLNTNNLIDTYRFLYPTKIEYSFWSYRFNSRLNNVGWRIDYFLINKKYIKNIVDSTILTDVIGSDHAPIMLKFKI